jgi:hypothetical protein
MANQCSDPCIYGNFPGTIFLKTADDDISKVAAFPTITGSQVLY